MYLASHDAQCQETHHVLLRQEIQMLRRSKNEKVKIGLITVYYNYYFNPYLCNYFPS
jgi:hypothetical protein